mgnify:CR=1 FL=1
MSISKARPDIDSQKVALPKPDRRKKFKTKVDKHIQRLFSEDIEFLKENHRVAYGMMSQVYKISLDGISYAVKVKGVHAIKSPIRYVLGTFINNVLWNEHMGYSNVSVTRRFNLEKKVRKMWQENGYKTTKEHPTSFQNVQILDWVEGNNLDQVFDKPIPVQKREKTYSLQHILDSDNLYNDEKLFAMDYVSQDLNYRQKYALGKDNPLLMPLDPNPSNVILVKDGDPLWLDSDVYIGKKTSPRKAARICTRRYLNSLISHIGLLEEEEADQIVKRACIFMDKDTLRAIVRVYDSRKSLIRAKEMLRNNILQKDNPPYRQVMQKVPEMIKTYLA